MKWNERITDDLYITRYHVNSKLRRRQLTSFRLSFLDSRLPAIISVKLAERVWGALNSSSFFWIFASVLVDSSSRPYLFTSASSVGSRRGARPAPSPTLFLGQNEARRAKKNFWEAGPSTYLRGWMTTPPPPAPYLKVWIRHWLGR